jgi:hypothetical protein
MLQPPADDAGEEEWASTMSMSEDVLLSTWCEMDFLTYPQLLLCECVNSTWRRKVRSALHSLRCLNLTCGSATLDESLLSIRQGQSAWQATPPPLLRPMWTLAEEGRLRIVEDAFGKLGICENLQALDLRSMGALSRKVSQGLALVLLARPVLQVSLTDLILPHMRCISSMSHLVSSFSSLQRLNLDSNFLGDEGATALAQALRLSGAPCLRRCLCVLVHVFTHKLASSRYPENSIVPVSSHSTLGCSLSLSQNNLGAVACAELAPALSSAGKALRSERWGLQELIISSNNIGDRGLRHLLVLTALHSLDVRSNGYTVQGCRMLWMLVNGLDVSRVSKLFLGRCLGWPNRIGDGGFVYIALALASLGHLRHLDLTRIGLSMQGCWLLSRVLCQLQHLSTAALGGVLAPTTAGGVLAPTTDPTTALPALSASLHKQHRAALFSSRLAQDRDEQQQQAQQREDHHRQEPAADVFGGLPWALGIATEGPGVRGMRVGVDVGVRVLGVSFLSH